MIKILSRIFIIALSITVLSWFLPWLYSFLLPDKGSEPYLSYSPIADRWILTETDDDKQTKIYDLGDDGVSPGNIYTKNERDSLLPQMFYTQLVARDQLPDTICGKEVSPRVFKTTTFVFQCTPRDVNKVQAEAYPIMESLPVRIELEDPTDVMILDNEVRIVDMVTNTERESRSRRFTKMFAEQGFEYPLVDFSANITTRKGYDEGYLMIDAGRGVYHVKQQAGRPYMRKIALPGSVKAKKVFITENVDRRNLGFVVDEENCLYVIESGSYKLTKLPGVAYNPTGDRITIMGNLFNWTIRITNETGSQWYAIDNDDYRLSGRYEYRYETSLLSTIAMYIFPFELTFTSVSDCFAYPRILNVSWSALILNVMLAAAAAVALRRNRRQAIEAATVTVVFGVFSFIPYLLLKD